MLYVQFILTYRCFQMRTAGRDSGFSLDTPDGFWHIMEAYDIVCIISGIKAKKRVGRHVGGCAFSLNCLVIVSAFILLIRLRWFERNYVDEQNSGRCRCCRHDSGA